MPFYTFIFIPKIKVNLAVDVSLVVSFNESQVSRRHSQFLIDMKMKIKKVKNKNGRKLKNGLNLKK